jgi:hypothetical protein
MIDEPILALPVPKRTYQYPLLRWGGHQYGLMMKHEHKTTHKAITILPMSVAM